nr:DC-STAMP domain-containing protein 2-like [Onthophagus taurus]
MSFVKLMYQAKILEKRKRRLLVEKQFAIALSQDSSAKPKGLLRFNIGRKILECVKKCTSVSEKSVMFKFLYKLRHNGSFENYILKSIVGFIGGFILTYIFFMFFVFQLNFTFSTATIMCSIFGSILTIGLAFSYNVRCIVFLTLPQLFSKRGRQALLAYAFILAITGPAKNTLNNMGILSESLACGQEQLKQAVKQILEAVKKPFYAIKDAIKTVVKVVKDVVKKIKEILLSIKRVIVSILKVIKSIFQFLARIINVCNKELGTPFQRCTRVFEDAIIDCHAKLGPKFSWLCSIAYVAQVVCYSVKMFDFICEIVDFIGNSIVGVVVKKVKQFIRHIKTMFYVRIRFSHSYGYQLNASKTMEDVAAGIVTEVKERTEGLMKIFDFMSCATSLFFIFMVVRVMYYRYKFLSDERFDNRFITRDFRAIDLRRAQLGKETVLPLNKRERHLYISVGSIRLVKKEKRKLSQAAVVLGIASLKLATHMIADYALFWVLTLIRRHASFQSSYDGSNIPKININGTGVLADLLRSIVKAFQPAGINLEIDTVPCLPDPIPPDYDRYVQIGSLLVICWFLAIFEPYGLRWRNSVMCFYHPLRAKQRAIWLYNHILRTRSSFLKFVRRQLRRKFAGDKLIAKVTCKEFMNAYLTKFPICHFLIKPMNQTVCLLCGEIFREGDKVKPIRCQTPGCAGTYCEKCFEDLQNVCTICLDPIQYGDLSDISEEK